MSLSITVPTIGQPFSSQAATVDSNFTNLSSWANGNIAGTDISSSAAIADTQLASPNNSLRRLLLTSSGTLAGTTNFGASTDYIIGGAASGGNVNATTPPAFWCPDSGLSSQPTDFTVAGKTRKARVRACVLVNGTTPVVNLAVGLYQLTGLGGASNVSLIVSFGSALAGSTASVANPLALTASQIESAEFNLPTAGNPCFLGVNVSGGSGTIATNSLVLITAQLYGYNV